MDVIALKGSQAAEWLSRTFRKCERPEGSGEKTPFLLEVTPEELIARSKKERQESGHYPAPIFLDIGVDQWSKLLGELKGHAPLLLAVRDEEATDALVEEAIRLGATNYIIMDTPWCDAELPWIIGVPPRGQGKLAGASPTMKPVFDFIETVGPVPDNCTLLGDTGAGSLRERMHEVPPMIRAKIAELRDGHYRHLIGVSPSAARELMTLEYDGNTRVLENILKVGAANRRKSVLDAAGPKGSSEAPYLIGISDILEPVNAQRERDDLILAVANTAAPTTGGASPQGAGDATQRKDLSERRRLIDRAFRLSRPGDILALADNDAAPDTLLHAARCLRNLLAFPAVIVVCDRLLRKEPKSWAAMELRALALSRVAPDQPTTRVIFVGHMIDAPDRATPRFPPEDEAEVARALRKELSSIRDKRGDFVVYLGGANGGDILFAEACFSSDAPHERVHFVLFLPFDEESFVETSVIPAGKHWVERFRLVKEHALETRVMSVDLGSWGSQSPYSSLNEWMLASAGAYGKANVIAVALWDGKGGKEGGTSEFVTRLKQSSIELIHIKTPSCRR